MRGFWAVTLLALGVFLLYPGIFIWQLTLLSVLMLAGAIAIALWDEATRQRPIVLIFAWMTGFILAIEVAYFIFTRFFVTIE